MKIRIAWAAASLGVLTCLSSAWGAAKITTQDGSVISGDIVSLQNGVYTIRTPYGMQTIPQASIRSIDNDSHEIAAKPPSTGPLRLAGSTTIGDDLAPALLESFASSKGDADVIWTQEGSAAEQLMEAKGSGNASFSAHLSRHGSGTAFTGLADGKADIGMASRRIEPAEASTLAAAGLGDLTQPGAGKRARARWDHRGRRQVQPGELADDRADQGHLPRQDHRLEPGRRDSGPDPYRRPRQQVRHRRHVQGAGDGRDAGVDGADRRRGRGGRRPQGAGRPGCDRLHRVRLPRRQQGVVDRHGMRARISPVGPLCPHRRIPAVAPALPVHAGKFRPMSTRSPSSITRWARAGRTSRRPRTSSISSRV